MKGILVGVFLVISLLFGGCESMSKADREFTTQLSLQYAATKYARSVDDTDLVAAEIDQLQLVLDFLNDPMEVLPLVADLLDKSDLLPEDRMLIMSLAEIGLRNADLDYTDRERIDLVKTGFTYFQAGLAYRVN